MKKINILSGLLVIIFTACQSGTKSGGDKYEDVFLKHESKINDIRKFLTDIPNSIQEAGTQNIVAENLSPKISLGNYDTTGNTLILQYHLLSAPEYFASNDSLFGLYYDIRAIDAFRWSGKTTKDRMIFERDYLKDEEVDKILSSLSTNCFPYLLVVKPSNFEPLTKGNNNTFKGGGATSSFYLYDLRSKKQLSSISLSAGPDNELLFAFNSKDTYHANENEAFDKKVRETLQKNMRLKVYEWLKDITNNNAVVPNY